MNKGSLIACKGEIRGFTVDKIYAICAGLGDGNIARTDGCVGGFITNVSQMCVKDDNGEIRLMSFNENWKMVRETENTNPVRVPVTHLYKPTRTGFVGR